MPDGYLILDEDGRVVDANTLARRAFAYLSDAVDDADDVIGSDAVELVASIDFDEGGGAPLDEGRFSLDMDGEQRHYSLQTTILEDDGFFIGRLVTLRDVTKKVRARQELRRERREFETLFAHMTDPVAKVDYAGGTPTVESVNEAFTETFGVDETVVGESLAPHIVPEGKVERAADVHDRIREGESVKVQVRRRTADGQRFFLLRSAPVEGEADPTAYLIYTDITAEKRRQAEMARQNRRLDQFASIVSHDLRNPLNVAQGLLRHVEDPDGNVEKSVESLDRMESMIEDVLTLARQGQTVGEPEPVELDEAAERAWKNVDTVDATLQVTDSTTVKADHDRLLRLFENLFRNAVEHGGEDVDVTVGSLDDGRGFFVADDGPGIPEDRREEVFDHGYTTNPRGTGFGLSIVRGIAEAHGWRVDVAESADGGARFEVTGVDSGDREVPDIELELDSPDSAPGS